MISKDDLFFVLLFVVFSIPNFVVLLSEKWIDLISYKKHGMTKKIGKSFAWETLAIIAVCILYLVYLAILCIGMVLFIISGQTLILSLIFVPLILSIAIPCVLFLAEYKGLMNPLEPKPSILTLISNAALSLVYDVAYGWLVAWYFLSDFELPAFGEKVEAVADPKKDFTFFALAIAFVVITIVLKFIIQWIIAKISVKRYLKRQQQSITETT
jgi:hypothetical protein